MIRKKSFIMLFIIFYTLFPALSMASMTFDPNYILSDEELEDYNSMSLNDVENFLGQQKGILKNYVCEDKAGEKRKAPEVIYTLAQKNKLNPKFMLTLLQKEQSLLTDPHPTENQLNAAVGYGCPDKGGCNPRWNSFFKQINSSYLQFRAYLDDNPKNYSNRYEPGNTYIFKRHNTDSATIDIVTPENKATAAFYDYTPHVYYGNYNFWKIWNEYFPSKDKFFPDGSLLKKKGEAGVYLIQNGEKRPFLTKSALLSRYSLDKVVEVGKNDLDAYKIGKPIKFSNYSLLRSEGKIYLLVDDSIRKIKSNEVFKKIGFNPEEIIDVEKKDLDGYTIGTTITEKDIYPTGALLQNKKTGGIYFVINGKKQPIWDKAIMKIDFPNKKIIPVSEKELAKYPTAAPLKIKDRELIKSFTSPVVYVISNGYKKPIASEETFNSLGYKWKNIIEVNNRVLEIHPTGATINLDSKNSGIQIAGM
ncbi:MAG: hypothetical protein GWO87_02290 [Xanthomonadaceae bacterium]|nr:hypothetical protein [Rhodospirillaceae bacterium]NIA17996.1 hypothetical protein [Xanthomonadaceae bacterium]